MYLVEKYYNSNSVTEISWAAFSGCTSLTSVKIPNSVNEIGWRAFLGCTSLTSITIPNSITEIGDKAFEGCTSLTSITIPNSVTEIGYDAFDGCTSLKSVYCKPTTPPRIYWSSIFYDKEGKPLGCKIYVPRASVEAYKTAEGWKEHADRIIGYDF